MLENSIDAQMTKEDEDQVIARLREAEALLPFMVNLTKHERMTLTKMGKKTVDFVERTILYAKEHPKYVPPFLNIEGQRRDMDLLRQVKRVLGVLEPFWEKLRDTYMVLGAEAYTASRAFYNSVKGAAKAGEPGSDIIVRDLAERYRKQYEKPKENQENGKRSATAADRANKILIEE